jgi:acyl carrier protein
VLTAASIPAMFFFLDEFPRTPSGKIDRTTLKTQELDPTPARVSSRNPQTRIERIVAKCWEDVLQVTGVGEGDDFFALGGDSLQALMMTSRLQQLLPVELPLSALFLQDPSFKGFINAIAEEIGDDGTSLFASQMTSPRI